MTVASSTRTTIAPNVYLGTDARAERFAGSFPADEIFVIPSATLGSKNPIALVKTIWKIWKGLRAVGKVISTIKPNVVVGFGDGRV